MPPAAEVGEGAAARRSWVPTAMKGRGGRTHGDRDPSPVRLREPGEHGQRRRGGDPPLHIAMVELIKVGSDDGGGPVGDEVVDEKGGTVQGRGHRDRWLRCGHG